jgi:hypothetical protein
MIFREVILYALPQEHKTPTNVQSFAPKEKESNTESKVGLTHSLICSIHPVRMPRRNASSLDLSLAYSAWISKVCLSVCPINRYTQTQTERST